MAPLGSAKAWRTVPELVLACAHHRAEVSLLADPEGRQLTGSQMLERLPDARPHDPLDIVYTSGTTGFPKPVLSIHSQWIKAVRTEMLSSRARRTVGHSGIPIGVSGGIHGVFLSHLARGVTSIWGR